MKVSSYNKLFDVISVENSKIHWIRLFLPTYALIFNRYIDKRDEKNKKRENHKKDNTDIDKKTGYPHLPPQPNFHINIPAGREEDKYSLPELNALIKRSLDEFEKEYSDMANLIQYDSCYTSSTADKCLYFYRLNRAFPMQFFLEILNPNYTTPLNFDYIKAVNKIPDTYTKCNFYKFIPLFSNNVESIKSVIDIIFPTIEEIFISYITIRYKENYKLLDNDLSEYLNKQISSTYVFDASILESKSNNIDCIASYYAIDFENSVPTWMDWNSFIENNRGHLDNTHVLYPLYLYKQNTYNHKIDFENQMQLDNQMHIKLDFLSGDISPKKYNKSIQEDNKIVLDKEPVTSEKEFAIRTISIINELFS